MADTAIGLPREQAASLFPEVPPSIGTQEDAERWEFQDWRKLLYALVGYDFGPDPENHLDEIRKYKANEAKFLIDSLELKPTDRVLDLGSGCGFIARVVAPLVRTLHCADISGEFLSFCREELKEFPNTHFLQMEFANLRPLRNKGINKAYANAVFIHFTLFDMVLYFRELYEVLVPGGIFVFGMSDTDTLDIASDRYFEVVLEAYRKNRREVTLMHWNSAKAVCEAARQAGFTPETLWSGPGSAMVKLEKPKEPRIEAAWLKKADEATELFRHARQVLAELRGKAQDLTTRQPGNRDARLLLAEVLRACGTEDLAKQEYERLLTDCPANERHRIEEGIRQCQGDRVYFPAAFAERVSTAEYASGHNAQVWRDYASRDIQRSREIVRTIRQILPVRGRKVLDVGAGYGGMMIALAESGAEVTGIEIDPERASVGRQRLADLGMHLPYHRGDACELNAEQFGKFDIVVCQDVLEHVLDPGRAIEVMSSLLNREGLIYLQIPNKYGIDQMMKDHHYALTGLTCLSRPQAMEYFSLATGEPAQNYTVGYERGERYYTGAFARHGVRLAPLERFPSIEYVEWYAPKISEMCQRLEGEIYPGLRPELVRRIRKRMTTVARLYAHACEQIIGMKDQPEVVAEASDLVVRRLCVGLWRFVGVKP